LKHDATIGPWAGDGLAVDGDGTGIRSDESGDDVEQGALAATGRPEDADELSWAHFERHAIDRSPKTRAPRERDPQVL
jgi:hypothetical protein